MKFKRYLALILAIAVSMTCIMVPAFAEGKDYGTIVNGTGGSVTLYCGEDSITVKGGKGEIVVDADNGNVKRPDDLQTNGDKTAVLTLPVLDLKDKDWDKLDLCVASKNDAAVSVKVGETEIASFPNINNNSWDNFSTPYTADLTPSEASGNLTINITGDGGNKYCGNYLYVKLYKSGVADEPITPTAAPAPTSKPIDPSDLLPYQDASLSFEERAADLVSRMTLEEKVGQIGYKATAIERLGVKAYDYWKEALHGVARQGKATSFPTALSMSNTWNRDLIEKMADIISTEARAKNNRYNLSYWSPTVNMARDPRWGRNEETYGEDPYLSAQIGSAFVRGMQGDDPKYLKTIATLKHFAANNNEQNRSSGSSVTTEFNFRNYYTRVFQNITEEVMPASVMSSYNGTTISRNGEYIYNFIPSLANKYLLQDLLRRNWGFDGYVTSDCGAGEYMGRSSQFKQGMLGRTDLPIEQYVAQFYINGLNVECNLSGGNWSTNYGVDAVKNGYLSEEQLERAVYELFLTRFRTGEFDEGATYQDITASAIETDENVAAAEEVAEESWVLLKNDNNTLPLKSDVTNVAVVGNMADKLVLGDYTGSPTKTVTPIQGLNEQIKTLNSNAEINHLGVVSDDSLLFNVKSIKFVLKSGKTRDIDLTKAKDVTGMTLSNGVLTDVTPKASATIENVDFNDVEKVQVEMSTGSRIGGTLSISYGKGGPNFANINSKTTASADEYEVCEFECGENADDYSAIKELCISAGAAAKDFSVENYKAQLDAADVIIAYAATTPKQGLGDADASESKDRANINLPASQAHVESICNAYPDKTIVVMSTVGQINVEEFKDKCKAILWTSYNGQTQGTALGKVLTGEVTPSGRLTTTWYQNSDVTKMELAGGSKKIGNITGSYTNYDIQADGTNPGHTYQYYNNTPIYPFGYGLSYTSFEYSNATIDNSTVDANGTVTFSVDVKNTGNVKGKEVVQLYVSHPASGAIGSGNMPKKQLKGFEKVELAPNETKTVEITLNVRDMYLFSETEQRDVVPAGEYKAYIAKDADDETNPIKFTVSGELESKLKTVRAIPSGVSVKGLIREDGTGLESLTTIDSNLTAIMSDEVWVDLTKAKVEYSSSNNEVATVNTEGKVTSGTKEGIAVITALVTVDGVTKTDSYPVVNKLEIKPSAEEVKAALASFKEAYDKLPKAAYSAENWATIEKIYAEGKEAIETAQTKVAINNVLALRINDLNSVTLDNLTEKYTLSSVNPLHIDTGVIDYREGGIPMYDGATGTVTNVNPYSGIQMQAFDESGNKLDNSKLVWQIKKFDNSVRKVADINSETGELTVYGNGIIQITAANVEELVCGTLMVQVNMQIEAEYADEANGADLNDSQSKPSGGFDAGSTGDAWIEYKSVKLSNLDSIVARYAGKNAGTINISLAKDTNPANLIATKNLSSTGGWGTWKDEELTINKEVIDNALLSGKLDEYGCAAIYIQTNGTNLDYFRLNYIENNDEEPYVIDKTINKTNGRIKATLSYRGSALAKEVNMISIVKDSEGRLKNTAVTEVKGTGEYEISTGASDGEDVSLYIWNSLFDIRPLAQPKKVKYATPVDSTFVVYTLDSKEYDYTVLTGGEDKVKYSATVNGLEGHGGWTLDTSSVEYTYIDVNEAPHKYTFTKAWKAGEGNSSNKRNLFFTPSAPCKVTAIFKAAVGNKTDCCMKIKCGDTEVIQPGTGDVAAVSLEVKNSDNPVYVYGGKKSQQLYAIIVEYYGTPATASEAALSASGDEVGEDRPVQFAKWGSTNVVLTENDVTGETKVWTIGMNDSRIPLNTNYFAESDVDYNNLVLKFNRLADYKGRLYAGCDGGLVAVFTDCMKCYKLKQVCDIDIKNMSIEDGVMYISDGTKDLEVNMSDIGGDSIEVDEASVLASNGAVYIDVRSAGEFAQKSFGGSVNIPLDDLKEGLSAYDKDTTLIFYCASGSRANEAVKVALNMGFTNVYNLGSIDKLI